MPSRLLDTNVLIRYFTRDDPAKGEQALTLLLRVEQGQEKLIATPMVIFETIFTLQHSYKQPRDQIRALMLPILQLRDLQLANKSVYVQALDIYVQHRVSFTDAFNAAFMQRQQIGEIYSWDTDFDRMPGIARIEP